jgi:hypothetical protein
VRGQLEHAARHAFGCTVHGLALLVAKCIKERGCACSTYTIPRTYASAMSFCSSGSVSSNTPPTALPAGRGWRDQRARTHVIVHTLTVQSQRFLTPLGSRHAQFDTAQRHAKVMSHTTHHTHAHPLACVSSSIITGGASPAHSAMYLCRRGILTQQHTSHSHTSRALTCAVRAASAAPRVRLQREVQ